MQIETYVAPPFDTNCYLVTCEKTGESIGVDAGKGFYDFVMQRGRPLKKVVLTHSHFDHIFDAHKFTEAGIPIALHRQDSENLRRPGADGLSLLMQPVPTSAFEMLKPNVDDYVGTSRFYALETPGHSPGSVSYFFPEEKILFSGDTLFKGTCGRTDFPGSDPGAMRSSLKKLMELEDEVLVYPGHFEPTTIKDEKKWVLPGGMP